MNKIIIIGGWKGGVGKTLVTTSIVENYIMRNLPLKIIETDTSNPDIYKVYSNVDDYIPELLNLDEKEGWLDFINLVDKTPLDTDIIINSAARSNEGVKEFGSLLNDNLTDLKRELVTFWPISRVRDCVELLRQYIEIMTNSKIYVLYNSFFGEKEKFEVYNASETSKIVNKRGGAYVFPDLAYRVIEIFSDKRKPPHTLTTEMPLGTRLEYQRWISAVGDILNKTIFSKE